MSEAPKPENEKERLETLRGLEVLDTAPEERFDRVTRMAKRLFDVPIAVVSLVDENRQWFKSRDGIEMGETDRRVAFCAHAILEREVFVVSDAREDERFRDNPYVAGAPGIRFYAGQPLLAPNGLAMGTLCVMGTDPRTFDKEQQGVLRDLAGMVEGELVALQLSVTDELTRISNRRGFGLLAQYSLDLCKRQKLPACLVFFDLDKFKLVNDRFGHEEGDRALKLCADQMRSSFRSSDVFARLGGDEFVALLTNAKEGDVRDKVERFARELAENCREKGLPYVLEFAPGIVAYDPRRHPKVEDLLREADGLMYERKRAKQAAA